MEEDLKYYSTFIQLIKSLKKLNINRRIITTTYNITRAHISIKNNGGTNKIINITRQLNQPAKMYMIGDFISTRTNYIIIRPRF
jgi:hypothetical protein